MLCISSHGLRLAGSFGLKTGNLGAALIFAAIGIVAPFPAAHADMPPMPTPEASRVDLRRTEENHLFVWGRANGKRLSVLVDTGWSHTTWNVSDSSNTSSTNIERLRLGSVTLTNVPAVVQDVRFNNQPASFGLVLGVDFFQDRGAMIDCTKRKLYLHMSQPTKSFAPGYIPVPMKLKNPLALTCPAIVNGHPVEMLVDTAAVWTFLDERQLARLELKSQPTPRKITGAGKTGKRNMAVSETREFKIGGVPLKNVNCAVVDLKDWGLAAPGARLAEVQGILGGGELARLNAIIDCRLLTLWIKP